MRRGVLDDRRLAPALSGIVPGLERALHLSGTEPGRPAGVVGLPRPILPRGRSCLSSRLIGGAGLLYLILLPTLMARDIWHELHACDGCPCGILQDTALKSPRKSRPHINLGRAWFQRGQFDLALKEFQQAELVSLEEPPQTRAIAEMLAGVNIANIFIHEQRWDEAHEILKEAWLKHPHFSGLALNLSMVYLTRTPPEAEKAEVFLSDAIRHIRDFPFGSWALGKLYFNRAVARGLLGRCVEMKRDGWKAQRLDPSVSVKDLHCFLN